MGVALSGLSALRPESDLRTGSQTAPSRRSTQWVFASGRRRRQGPVAPGRRSAQAQGCQARRPHDLLRQLRPHIPSVFALLHDNEETVAVAPAFPELSDRPLLARIIALDVTRALVFRDEQSTVPQLGDEIRVEFTGRGRKPERGRMARDVPAARTLLPSSCREPRRTGPLRRLRRRRTPEHALGNAFVVSTARGGAARRDTYRPGIGRPSRTTPPPWLPGPSRYCLYTLFRSCWRIAAILLRILRARMNLQRITAAICMVLSSIR